MHIFTSWMIYYIRKSHFEDVMDIYDTIDDVIKMYHILFPVTFKRPSRTKPGSLYRNGRTSNFSEF